MTCPTCGGGGCFRDAMLSQVGTWREGDCSHCSGTGSIGFKRWLHYHILTFLNWLLL